LLKSLAALVVLAAAIAAAEADATRVAVAANLADAAREIAAGFHAATGHEAVLSFGATGQLYTQITQGAPFDVFLAADAERPARAVEAGLGVRGSIFTYAVGQLVLYSADADLVAGPATLAAGKFRKIAIANPETAPYGLAALQVLQALGVHDALKARIVQGQTIAQAFQFVETGNAELGFVALGQIAGVEVGSRWIVPQAYYQPIRQDAVLLKTGEGNPAAIAFLEFLKGEEAAAIVERHGYVRGQ